MSRAQKKNQRKYTGLFGYGQGRDRTADTRIMCQRIRYALKDVESESKLEGIVEADETYVGGKVRGRGRRYTGNKTTVVSLVERGGQVRSQTVPKATAKDLDRLLKVHVSPVAHLHTDESPLYHMAGWGFASHETVNHSEKEYVRRGKRGRKVTTNTVEGFFGNTKRSISGTHHHVSGKHLPLYLAEFDHKYNTREMSDGKRTEAGIRKMEGKRLMLRKPKAGQAR